MHIIGILCAVLVPLAMLLKYLGNDDESRTAWELFKRIDIVVLIFCVLAAALLLASLLGGHRASLGTAAAALLFAAFGFMLGFALDLPAQDDDISAKIGGYLVPILALAGAGAATYAAGLAPMGAGAAPVGAGRDAPPNITAPITAPAPTGAPQEPPGGGGTQPGWYADPEGKARLRYYDGREWTEQTSN